MLCVYIFNRNKRKKVKSVEPQIIEQQETQTIEQKEPEKAPVQVPYGHLLDKYKNVSMETKEMEALEFYKDVLSVAKDKCIKSAFFLLVYV